MWTKLVKYLAEFPNATLSGRDKAGYPYCLRCVPRPDLDKHALHLQLAEDEPLQPGPASLLCHEHDEWIDNMKSFVVRGRLEKDGGWLFYPKQFVTGVGVGFMAGMPGMVRRTRRNCARYLEERGLARPEVNWEEVSQIWSEVK